MRVPFWRVFDPPRPSYGGWLVSPDFSFVRLVINGRLPRVTS